MNNPTQPEPSSQSTSTSALQQFLESVWYENGSGKYLLFPLERIYRGLATLDRYFKKRKQITHAVPVVVVGNISVGGTGKTPLVIYLCELLTSKGYRPGIITRGYGGESDKWPISVPAGSSVVDCGDEAVLMANRAGVPVAAGPNRNDDIEHLLDKRDIDVVVSDDGLQHYQLRRDIEIAVVDASRGFGNGHCLPAGPLREPVKRLERCDFVVTNEVVKAAKYSMQQRAGSLINLKTGAEMSLSALTEQQVHAVTGIGNPVRFFNSLKSVGLMVIEHSFPDHHAFSAEEISFEDDLPVLMTEKDAVKCQAFANEKHWYLPITAELPSAFDDAFMSRLKDILSNRQHAGLVKDMES